MNRKVLTTIQIVLAVIVLVYWVLPDFMLGPLDDGVIAALAFIAEIVLFVIRTVQMPANSGKSSRNTSYQQNYQDTGYSGSANYQQNYQDTGYSDSTNYQQNNQSNGSGQYSNDQNDEFQFFAGCTDWEQVKSRYRDLMKIYHPDAGGHEEASKKINAEYNILKKKFGH